MHPAVVLHVCFVSWPAKAVKVGDSTEIRQSFSSFNAR